MTSLISSISYARLSAPDLGAMQDFLEAFGLVKEHRDEHRLYMRGTGPAPFLHVTEKGPAGTLGYGYNVVDDSVLSQLAAHADASGIEHPDEPGGGRRVTLIDPNGLHVELIAGRGSVEPLPPRVKLRPPAGASVRLEPARIRRIAHAVVATPRLAETISWFNSTLRLIPTDELYVGTPDNLLGQFSRIDSGETLVDHHVIFVLRSQNAGSHHLSFEVDDVDDIFVGHDYLKRQNRYEHVRGIGRHALGSQLFDYWMSPFEQMHEHWYTTEVMNSQSGFNSHRVDAELGHDHGEKPTPRFVRHASPFLGRNTQAVTP